MLSQKAANKNVFLQEVSSNILNILKNKNQHNSDYLEGKLTNIMSLKNVCKLLLFSFYKVILRNLGNSSMTQHDVFSHGFSPISAGVSRGALALQDTISTPDPF